MSVSPPLALLMSPRRRAAGKGAIQIMKSTQDTALLAILSDASRFAEMAGVTGPRSRAHSKGGWPLLRYMRPPMPSLILIGFDKPHSFGFIMSMLRNLISAKCVRT